MPKNESYAPPVTDVTRKERVKPHARVVGNNTYKPVPKSTYAPHSAAPKRNADMAEPLVRRIPNSKSPVGFNRDGSNTVRG